MTNLTNLRTKKMITDSFVELLVERTFSSITINDICNRSMIHRSTFYRYYEDKYDLFSEISTTIAENLFLNDNSEDYQTLFEKIINYVDDNRKFFLNITTKNQNIELYEKMIKFGSKDLYQTALEHNDPLSTKIKNSEYPILICDFYSSGIFEIIKNWINNEYPYTKIELIKIIENFFITFK